MSRQSVRIYVLIKHVYQAHITAINIMSSVQMYLSQYNKALCKFHKMVLMRLKLTCSERTNDAPIVFMRKSFRMACILGFPGNSVTFVLNELERKELPYRLFGTDRVNGGT